MDFDITPDTLDITPDTRGLIRWLRELAKTDRPTAMKILVDGWPMSVKEAEELLGNEEAAEFEGHGHAGLTDQELYDHENTPPLENPMDWEK